MSNIQIRLEVSIQQARKEIEYNTDLEKHGESEMKTGYRLQILDWEQRLANLI